MLFRIMSQMERTLVARLDSSPEEYFRKKLTGRERIRMMTEASTAIEVRVLIRFISSVRIRSISLAAKAEDSRNTPMPASRFRFRLCSTVPVTSPMTCGSIMPTSTASRETRMISTRSPLEMLFFI